MIQLILEKHVYRADSEQEGADLIDKYKGGQLTEGYTLKKSGLEHKTKKSKGEVIDEWWLASVEKTFEITE